MTTGNDIQTSNLPTSENKSAGARRDFSIGNNSFLVLFAVDALYQIQNFHSIPCAPKCLNFV